MAKTSLNLVVVGHVDHGKSTVIGRLLHDTESLPQGTIDKVKRIAKETGKPFEYAYLLDAFEEEQQQGITIDITQIQFQTKNRAYLIIDAPGHVEFLKNMISGAASAEAAFLIVDVQRGVEEQTKRHAYMLKLLGIQKVYAIFNKMDLTGYSKNRFKQVQLDLQQFIKSLDFEILDYIPISAFYGENILKQTGVMPWYTGKTLIELLDSIEKDADIANQPLRLPIQDVYKFDDRRIISGRVESGTLSVGDTIQIFPEGRTTVVEGFAYWQKKDQKQRALPGESIGITVKDEFFNNRGEIITKTDTAPIVANAFSANIFWMGKAPLIKNKRYKLKLATQEIYGEVVRIENVLDASTLEQFENANQVKINDVAEVVFATEQAIVFDAFKDFSITGRFVIIDGYDVSGGGTVAEQRILGEAALKGINITNNEKLLALHAFDEYFIYQGGKIESEAQQKLYHLGEQITLKGATYHYPANFDILVINEKTVVSVRNGHFDAFLPLEVFEFSKFPLISSDGFAIEITSQSDFLQFLDEYQYLEGKNKAHFYNKWLSFEKYRQLYFSDNYYLI
ncbi:MULTISPECIES: GTP-binding protein [unclassified Enterococcus]|uniref:sulfate adenylyltransferase subunit 1 n=1 Tax=unclassified Enterococcus TaxID=2608891 RepID=UPI0015553F05|nr:MULTISPECIES: GTP-binding protein [unclassified Enterococcus]MBS7576401.1 GTP-binding protein [Enterococcus sp. MMGLQ5-2]MBS7583633.1 GTP-binding protein [Enterococcus sp. MMGLQ5-1]NPD11494.1 GTP-binding protein [Enterococcus sp. MMGLQ5-1]NPD36238.1 GTP-binding protein [Enterococcus sp. MMGLQ5-2]